MDSWSGNCPFDPRALPSPWNALTSVSGWSGPPAVHVRPPSGERESQSATCLPRYPKQVKYAVPPSGLNATAGSPPKSYVPVPGTAGSVVDFGVAGVKALGGRERGG